MYSIMTNKPEMAKLFIKEGRVSVPMIDSAFIFNILNTHIE